MNARSVTWKMCGALAFHFHATAKDADKWTDDEWADWKRMRACFWGQAQEGLLNRDEVEKLFLEPKGDLPKKFEDLIENWEPTIKRSSSSKKKKDSYVSSAKDPEGFKILKIVRDE
mgnify:CR=1 FL=1|tara:strand:+ start:958 stop:1305 length:348 start_codon:yes stop_codon:yes gene_type:complete